MATRGYIYTFKVSLQCMQFVALLFLAIFINEKSYASVYINSLDTTHQVTIEKTKGGNSLHILYNDEKLAIDANHLYLDGEMSDEESKVSPYIYNNVREALMAVNLVSDTSADKTIYIASGVYWVDDPNSPEVKVGNDQNIPYGMVIECHKLSLIGLTNNPENVVLACNRGNTQGAVGDYAMLNLISKEIETSNITYGNYCNVDLSFPLKKEYDREKRTPALTQAQLVLTNADKVFAQNCRFIGRQKLSPFAGGHRILFDNCYMECTENALASSAVYHKCKFTFYSSKPFLETEHYGAILLGCKINTNVIGTQYFSKNNGSFTVIDTDFNTLRTDSLIISFNYLPKTDSWYYSNMSINGNPIHIKSAMDITNLPILSAYKLNINGEDIYNIANLMAGDDNWDPLHQREIISEEYLNIPTYMQIQNKGEGIMLSPFDDKTDLEISFYRWGGYKATNAEVEKVADNNINWKKPNCVFILPSNGAFNYELLTKYDQRERFNGKIAAAVYSGLYATNSISIAPYLHEAPFFERKPKISFNQEEMALVLDYKLTKDDSGKENPVDNSSITWYRYTNDNLSDTIPILCGIANDETKMYHLKEGDYNYKFMAEVTPEYYDTFSGMPVNVYFTEIIKKTQAPTIYGQESHYYTDFHDLPVRYQPKQLPGIWTFDAFKPIDTNNFGWELLPEIAWYYGNAKYGVKGNGLVQNTRGSRCIYIPSRDKSGDMKATVNIDLAKTSGQGFGSATSQYLDICIKFDPETLCGYAIRIERTPTWNNAVEFSLIKYVNGKTERLCEPVVSNCFVSTCTVTIEQKGKKLIATANTNSTNIKKHVNNKVKNSVYLKTTIDKTPLSAFYLQHTGTSGNACAVFRSVELDWK